jgi:uncharacterized protein YggT (Ycf19 family)
MKKRAILKSIINWFVFIVETILGLRVLFLILNANPTAPFVNWIYRTSDTILSPFRGIFTAQSISLGHILDITALFAMLMYSLFGFLLESLVSLIPETKKPK